MDFLSSKDILKHIDNIIHQDTQLHTNCIDLTVKSIGWPAMVGSLDFGGGEFKPMKTDAIPATKRDSEDDYGWWNLQPGTYQANFNEQFSLPDDVLALISLHSHATQAGLMGNTQILNTANEPSIIFQVPRCGCNIKENARLAAAYLFNH